MRRPAIAFILLLSIFLVAPALQADDAATIYKSKCGACHGPDGAGATSMGKKLGLKSLAAPETQGKSDAALHAVIAKGAGKMPGFAGKIADGDIKALVAHIRSLAKK